MFEVQGRALLCQKLGQLSLETNRAAELLSEQVETLDAGIATVEERVREVLSPSPKVELLQTLPGGILATVITWKWGMCKDFRVQSIWFLRGTVPRGKSGSKDRHGKVRDDVNRYLK